MYKNVKSPTKSRGTSTQKQSSQMRQKRGERSGLPINKVNMKGETNLHKACMNNKPQQVASLLRTSGIDVNCVDNLGWTPLSEACANGYVQCVEELLKLPEGKADHGVKNGIPALVIDLELSPQYENTPLHDAVSNGHVEIVKMLLQKGGLALMNRPKTMRSGKNKKNYQFEEVTPMDLINERDRDEIQQVIKVVGENRSKVDNGNEDVTKLVDLKTYKTLSDGFLSNKSVYKKIIKKLKLKCDKHSWIDACHCYVTLVRHLLLSYIRRKRLDEIVSVLTRNDLNMYSEEKDFEYNLFKEMSFSPNGNKTENNIDEPPRKKFKAIKQSNKQPSDMEVWKERGCSDLFALLRLREVEMMFQTHVDRLIDMACDGKVIVNMNIFSWDLLEEKLPKAIKNI